MKTKSISRELVLRGALYSLDAAAYFLKRAKKEFDAASYPTALVLGTVAAEDVGEFMYRLKIWLSKTPDVLIRSISRDKHEDKIRSGMVIIQANLPINEFELNSPEWQKREMEGWEALEKLRKRRPSVFHLARIRSQYVDITENGTDWSRPTDITRSEAHDLLLQTSNNYRVAFSSFFRRYPDAVALARDLGILSEIGPITDTHPGYD